MSRIERAKKYLEELYRKSEYLQSKPLERAYRYEHTLRVSQWGRRIAENEGLDSEAIVVGCLLHDASYCEEMTSTEVALNHGRRSVQIVGEFVRSLGFSHEITNAILYGIATHVDGKADFPGEASIISESISDADNLDRFDVYRIYESMEFEKFSEKLLDDKIEYCQKRQANAHKLLSRSFATDYATAVFHEELRTMIAFFSGLEKQLTLVDFEAKILQ